jgi:hypothetical protein
MLLVEAGVCNSLSLRIERIVAYPEVTFWSTAPVKREAGVFPASC